MKSRREGTERANRFKERVQSWATRIHVKPKQIRLQKMARKWASCSTVGWVTFSEDLLHQSGALQDYVIVHELLHLRVHNHGKLFKSYLSTYLPDWQDSLLEAVGSCSFRQPEGV